MSVVRHGRDCATSGRQCQATEAKLAELITYECSKPPAVLKVQTMKLGGPVPGLDVSAQMAKGGAVERAFRALASPPAAWPLLLHQCLASIPREDTAGKS